MCSWRLSNSRAPAISVVAEKIRLHRLAKRGAAVLPGVEHVSARKFMNGDPVAKRIGHLIDAQDRSHEWAGKVVPSMADEHLQARVGGNGLAELRDRAAAQRVIRLPRAIHVVGK